MKPENIWWLSCQAHQRKLTLIAKFLKFVNFLLFHAILPYEAEIERNVILAHYGLGIVIHPNVKLGNRVKIHQHVTLAATTWIGSEHKIVIGDDWGWGSNHYQRKSKSNDRKCRESMHQCSCDQ
jgi:serine O-acetyltransferase